MIVWTLGRRASEICTCPCENTSWWLPLRSLRHRLWDLSCSFSLTQSLCLWASRIAVMTPLINKNERHICDRIHPVKSFIMENLHNCNVARSSLHHLRRCFVFYGGHTSKNRRISWHGSSSHRLCSSWRHLCCFFRLDICVWVCIILVYVRKYVYTWRSVIFSSFRMKTFHYVVILEDRENMDPSRGKNN